MNLGEQLKKIRINNNLKQSELGKALNVTGATISSWETGRTQPSLEMIQKIVDVLHVDAWDFYSNYELPDYFPEEINDEEKELLENYRDLNDEQQEFIKYIINRERNKK